MHYGQQKNVIYQIIGEVKLKIGGGHAGHNGLRDISQQIGNDYVRLRFGIGHPPSNTDTNAWL